MLTGWLQQGANWYYVNADGAMAHDRWLLIDGKYYYFYSSGSMAVSYTHLDVYKRQHSLYRSQDERAGFHFHPAGSDGNSPGHSRQQSTGPGFLDLIITTKNRDEISSRFYHLY